MSAFDLLVIREETFVAEVFYFEELDSTNSKAIELLASKDLGRAADENLPALTHPSPALFRCAGESEGSFESAARLKTPFLVLAEKQTAGRGRGQNQWWSAEGALTFSLVLDTTDLDVEQTCKVSLAIGLSVCQALERFAAVADFALKWPNDVFLEGKKVCGVLIERPAHAQDHLVIGIGINVNNSCLDAPVELQPTATSMFDCLGDEIDLNLVLIECLHHAERNLAQVSRSDRGLLDQWQAYDMLLGRNVTIKGHAREISGVCRGIDSTGALVIETDQGKETCIAGVVELQS